MVIAGVVAGGLVGGGCGNLDHGNRQSGQSQCYVCHQTEYEATTQPVHVGGFPTACGTCHSTTAWQPASFDHRWPLTGAHADADCQSCHTGDPPVWAGLPTVCVGCHQADYDASPYPGHSTFPTTCDSCHITTAWSPALEGQHPNNAFPISSGPHDRFECMDCHDPNLGSSVDGMNTDCVGCHTGAHTRSRMDPKHHEVSGYPSGAAPPNFCLDCHPSGRGD